MNQPCVMLLTLVLYVILNASILCGSTTPLRLIDNEQAMEIPNTSMCKKGKTVTSLDMSNIKLHSLGKRLENCKDLIYMDLSKNKLNIDDLTIDLPNLTELKIGLGENIKSNLLKTAPNLVRLELTSESNEIPNDIFYTVPKLESLHLVLNKVENIPADLFNKTEQLTEIVIIAKKASILPGELFLNVKNLRQLTVDMPRLNEYNMTHNMDLGQLEQLRLKNIQVVDESSFKHLKGLRTLSLEGIQKINTSNTFKNNTILQILEINSCNVKKILFGWFSKLNELRDLKIINNPLTHLHGKEFVGLNKLHRLDLTNNNLQLLGAGSLDPMKSSLRVLMLRNNNLSIIANSDLRDFGNLTTLDLSCNRLIKINMSGQFTDLVNFNVSFNSFTYDSLQLGKVDRLEKLDISSNALQKLPAFISSLKSLKVLKMSNNTISSLQAGKLCEKGTRIIGDINPLDCDCKDILACKELFTGTCTLPIYYKGRDIQDLFRSKACNSNSSTISTTTHTSSSISSLISFMTRKTTTKATTTFTTAATKKPSSTLTTITKPTIKKPTTTSHNTRIATYPTTSSKRARETTAFKSGVMRKIVPLKEMHETSTRKSTTVSPIFSNNTKSFNRIDPENIQDNKNETSNVSTPIVIDSNSPSNTSVVSNFTDNKPQMNETDIVFRKMTSIVEEKDKLELVESPLEVETTQLIAGLVVAVSVMLTIAVGVWLVKAKRQSGNYFPWSRQTNEPSTDNVEIQERLTN